MPGRDALGCRGRGIAKRKRPDVPTAADKERTSTRWHPEHRAATVEIRAPEEPLRTAKMARKRSQSDALIGSADPYAKPAFIGGYVRSDDAGGDFLFGVAIRPRMTNGPVDAPGRIISREPMY